MVPGKLDVLWLSVLNMEASVDARPLLGVITPVGAARSMAMSEPSAVMEVVLEVDELDEPEVVEI